MADCIVRNSKIHIEVPTLFLFFAFMLSDSVGTTLILFRTCSVMLGYNESVCENFLVNNTNNTDGVEEIVQVKASYIMLILSIIENVIPTLLCVFCGPWSDKYGRKPLMITILTAFSIGYITKVIFSVIPTLSPWYLIISSVCAVTTGGFSTYLTAVLCYIADVTSPDDRSMRMGSFDVTMSLGIILGTTLSSYTFKAIGFAGVFVISACFVILALLYTIFFVPESIENADSLKTKMKDLFHYSHIKLMFITTFKKREHYGRALLLLIIAMLILNVMNITGDSNIMFLYIREKFHWSLQHYTLFIAGKALCWIMGTIIGVYVLHKLCQIPELSLVLVGLFSIIASLLLQGVASKDWHLYLAISIRSLGSVLGPMIRTIMSKCVPAHEIGKVFAFSVILESGFSALGPIIYTAIYDSTLNVYPGSFNFFTAGVNAVNVVITVIIIFVRKYQQSYITIEETTSSINS